MVAEGREIQLTVSHRAHAIRAGARSDRMFVLAVTSLLIGVLVTEFLGTTILFQIGSYDVNTIDPVFLLVCFAAARSLKASTPRVDALALLALGIGALIIVSFVRGSLESAFDAFVWLRTSAMLLPLFLLVFKAQSSTWIARSTQRLFVMASAVLTALVVARFIFGVDLFMIAHDTPVDLINDDGRPLSVNGAMTLVVASAMLLSDAFRRGADGASVRKLWMAGIFLIALVATRQGTATICGVTSVALLLFFERGQLSGIRRFIYTSCAVLAGTILAVMALYMPQSIMGNLDRREGNVVFRHFIWDGFVDSFHGWPLLDKVIGPPAGQKLIFYMDSMHGVREWELSLHSMYLGMIAKLGYVGLALYCLLLAIIGYRLSKQFRGAVKPGDFSPTLGICLLVSALLLGYTYEVRNDEVLLIVLPLLLARRKVDAGRRPRSGLSPKPVSSVRLNDTPIVSSASSLV